MLKLNRPDDVIPLVEIGIRTAEKKGYRPLLWRLRAAKAQALRLNGDTAGAAQEYKASAESVRRLADTINDHEFFCALCQIAPGDIQCIDVPACLHQMRTEQIEHQPLSVGEIGQTPAQGNSH